MTETQFQFRPEPIEIIDDWGIGWGFCVGSALELILHSQLCRSNELNDLKKALWYCWHANDLCVEHDLDPKVFFPMKIAKAWGLSGRFQMTVEHLCCGKPKEAAEELERYLDEEFSGWREGLMIDGQP